MSRSATTKSIIIPNMRIETIGKNRKKVNQYEDHYRRKIITSYDNLSYHK